jgi:hypothetical protein
MSLLSRLAVQAARAYGILSAADKTKVTASYLAVAGGGGGGRQYGGQGGGGGGGAGGYQTSTFTLSTLNTYAITVGAGGAGGSLAGAAPNGSDSIISGTGLSTVTSVGGGGGAGSSGSGANGGSGGGGQGEAAPKTGGSGTSGQGNAGGSGANAGGGGGGASAVGANAVTVVGGAGGNGSSSSISGSSVTYAGGGGGGGYTGAGGAGGTGGGGAGGTGSTNSGQAAGTSNTGGGGGGAAYVSSGNYNGAAGGSGIVIISYASATPKFVGGTLTTSGGNQIHTFTSSGTLSPITPITASYLVVAGGASGGVNGGGGAGGYRTSSTTLYSGATYIVTVGAGGAGSTSQQGNNGSDSLLSGTGLTTITSTGGGGGGGESSTSVYNGKDGGSGGGSGNSSTAYGTPGNGNTPSTSPSQGNNGGSAVAGTTNSANGGGGGGAGAVGGNSTGVSTSGNGGAGSASSISGSSVTYAGGGGGGAYIFGGTGTAGTGGLGGGGNGGRNGLISTSGTVNTGGGGGGRGLDSTGNGVGSGSGSGGSGIVIISYAGSQVFNGGLVTSSGGNTIHTFTATGALTPLTNNLNNSLRFRSSASAYLNRTPTLTGNRQTFTYSFWTKLGGVISVGGDFISSNNAAGGGDAIALQSSNRIAIAGSGTNLLVTTQLLRDPSAWYHIVVAVDTTQATSANRIKLYINGNQVTAFNTASYPALNYNFAYWNNSSYAQLIGGGYSYLDGYMTDINFIDGQALEPYYFGNNDANGVWKPIKYTGTYGTNGFYLTFGNTTSTTTLGYDSSGNGNNWTTSGISVTAGNTYDAMLDVPTNTSATVANYPTLNPLSPSSISATLSEANLKATGISTGTFESAISTMSFTSGKIYFECTCLSGTGANASSFIGITPISNATSGACFTNSGSGSIGWDINGTTLYTIINTTVTSRGAITPTNKVFRVAYDSSTGNIWLGYDTTWIGGGDPSTLTTPTGTLATGAEYICGATLNTSNDSIAINFGQRPFAQTIPTGFTSLNTYNLPTPTILQGNKYMDATTYSAASPTNRVIVNQAQFRPDLVWIKSRSQAYSHYLFDSNRGVGAGALSSNNTSVQNWDTGTQLSSFNSNGYTISSGDAISDTSAVAWQWQAGQGTNTTNTSGSITSTVSVNTTAGFSIVTYTGNNTASTVGHGLGVSPKFIIVKDRSNTNPWAVYHVSLGVQKYIFLNATDAAYSNLANYWGSTTPSSTTFGIGAYGGINTNADNYVAYCWAEISGFSKFGSYTGNSSTDGPFVYLGFRPKFVIFKDYSNAHSWVMVDSSRNTYNVAGDYLRAESSAAENATYSVANNTAVDFLSNGFKLRNAAVNSGENNGSSNYLYMAFAEHPFKNANAR